MWGARGVPSAVSGGRGWSWREKIGGSKTIWEPPNCARARAGRVRQRTTAAKQMYRRCMWLPPIKFAADRVVRCSDRWRRGSASNPTSRLGHDSGAVFRPMPPVLLEHPLGGQDLFLRSGSGECYSNGLAREVEEASAHA